MGAWSLLAGAVALEIAATLMLKMSDGLLKWPWAAGAIGCYILCFFLFAPALKYIPVGVAYAVWAGMGIVAMSVIGLYGFGESLSIQQIGFIALVVSGVVGLRLTTA